MDKPTVNWQTYIEYAELTDQGLRRSNNQDSHGSVIASSDALWQRRGHLFMVADGMGAHAAGELASKIAVDTVRLSYYKLPDASPAVALRKAVEEANANIFTRGQSNPDFKGMGTTTTSLALLPQGALVAHVGDSRIYRLRGNRLEQLSADHSLVWEMMAASHITDKDLPNYIPKNVITRSLGPSAAVQVDLEGIFPLVEGDTFLLCSDGLSGQVPEDELAVILQVLRPAEAARMAIELANLRGGPDNITVIIVRVLGVPSADAVQSPGQNVSASNRATSPALLPVSLVAGVGILLAAVLFAAGSTLAALISSLVGITAGFVALLLRTGVAGDGAEPAVSGGMLGKGPHRSQIVAPSIELLTRWKQLIEPVCQTARTQQWEIDWNTFDEHRRRAEGAAGQEQYPLAAREFCLAMLALMNDVRTQRRKRPAPG